MSRKAYKFGDFLLDAGQKRLFRNGEKISLQPKVFDILLVLLEKNGELVSRDELMKAVWKDTFVEETNLRFCIHALRKVLGKKSDGEEYVETVPKRGYRLNEKIREKSIEAAAELGIAEIIKPESSPPEQIQKAPAKRFWLFGIAAIAFIFLLIAVIAWQFKDRKLAENARIFETLAILPFESASENQTDLQIGLASAMISNLSKIKQLKVLPLAAVRKFAGQNSDILAVGKELKADSVLSGTYRFDENNALVTVKLSRVADGETIWSEKFQTARKSGLEFENEIAARTARLLSSKIADLEDEKSVADQNVKPEAAQNYLAARKIWRAGELNRRREMVGLFEKTIALEPNWASAYAAFAETLVTPDQLSVEWEKAEQNARKAAELDKTLAQPSMIFGEISHWRDWNWEKAEGEYKQAIALNPNYASARSKYARLLLFERRFAEAEDQLNKAIEIEPFSPQLYCSLCQLYTFDKKFDKALESCNYARKIEPDYWWTPKLLYWIYIQKKMSSELGELVLGKLSPSARAAHPLTKALTENDLRPFFQGLIDEPSRSGRENPVTKAMLYVQLGENDKAFENLEKALAARDPNLPLVNADSAFDPIRGDKRFYSLMSRVGLQK